MFLLEGHGKEEDSVFGDDGVYQGVDASSTIVLHGLESDFIEESMQDVGAEFK